MLGNIALGALGIGLKELIKLRERNSVSRTALVVQLTIRMASLDTPPHEALQHAEYYADQIINRIQQLSEEDIQDLKEELINDLEIG